jgi:hypothetical protein
MLNTQENTFDRGVVHFCFSWAEPQEQVIGWVNHHPGIDLCRANPGSQRQYDCGNEAEIFQVLDWTFINLIGWTVPLWNPCYMGCPVDPMLHVYDLNHNPNLAIWC